MCEISFSEGTLFGYFFSGVICLVLPAAVFLYLVKYRSSRIYPVITGAVVYYVSTTLCDLTANLMGFSMSYGNRIVIATELVCIFEEVGRWLAMKYPITDIKNTRSAVCYGIGHGGLECVIRGFQKFKLFGYGRQINSRGLDSFITGKSEEQVLAIEKQLRIYADYPLYVSLLDSLHSLTAFSVQIALSLLIYKKMSETDNELRWVLIAIGLHYGLNGAGWLASLTENPVFTNIVGIICGAAVTVFVFRQIGLRNCVCAIKHPEYDE